MAARMGATLEALRKLEAGDPSASLGTFAAAIWVFDSWPGLGFVASVEADKSGVPWEDRRYPRRRRLSDDDPNDAF